ncbi:Cys-tRNA(Pro) deacylase [uncultured Faecalibaculum sp.]|uniref:Cys-tRNA(Pro) deacylase n=1 Tax=uncultured Faecalibaculum sp. TaxID=1729681 RepID=UPI002731A6B3|nr:Cys-tRNA(Pro) deacylase [uncultured Faecalibaculum sp.]
MHKSKTNAMRMLDAASIPYEAIEYEHSPHDPVDGVSVARSLQEDPAAVFKTLVTRSGSSHFVFLVPVDRELDLKQCARAAGVKSLEMLPLKDLTKVTGYVRGGCSPVGMKKRFATFADASLTGHDQVHVSGGQIGLQLKIRPADLIQAADIKLAEIARQGE